MRALTVLFGLTTLVCVLSHEMSTQLSFSAPFKQFTYSGKRRIDGWECTGDSVINEFFVRLTPDRQSKTGSCWSQFGMNSKDWVTVIKFRISGQGASLFGDGFAVFFTNQANFIPGKMWGVTDVFRGFAVGFSTFRNTEFSRYHRDIALYVGDGENSAFVQDKDHTGCYSKYRYHEKRQDFSVDNYAVVKIGYEGDTQTVRVSIDEKNTGDFHTCFTDSLNLNPDWWRNIHIGISSTTGQLADNHDILSVETYLDVWDPEKVSETKSHEAEEVEKQENELFMRMVNSHSVNINALDANEKGLMKVMEKLDQKQRASLSKLEREMEHKIVAVDDSLNAMIKKLQERGDVSENRIQAVEASLKREMQNQISNTMESRLSVLEDVFRKNLKEAVSKSNKRWVIPFAIVGLAIVVAVGVIYMKYRNLQKSHLL